jgi:hypothetical protein
MLRLRTTLKMHYSYFLLLGNKFEVNETRSLYE